MPKRDAPYQITRVPNTHKPGTYDFQLRQVATGKLVCGDYRCKSSFPPRYMLEHQARLNTAAILDGIGIV